MALTSLKDRPEDKIFRYLSTHACMHACTHIRIHAHTHTWTHTHTHTPELACLLKLPPIHWSATSTTSPRPPCSMAVTQGRSSSNSLLVSMSPGPDQIKSDQIRADQTSCVSLCVSALLMVSEVHVDVTFALLLTRTTIIMRFIDWY